MVLQGFPGGPVVENPWCGKIPHVAGQLSPCALTIQPAP